MEEAELAGELRRASSFIFARLSSSFCARIVLSRFFTIVSITASGATVRGLHEPRARSFALLSGVCGERSSRAALGCRGGDRRACVGEPTSSRALQSSRGRVHASMR